MTEQYPRQVDNLPTEFSPGIDRFLWLCDRIGLKANQAKRKDGVPIAHNCDLIGLFIHKITILILFFDVFGSHYPNAERGPNEVGHLLLFE